MKEIKLTRGKVATVDDSDFEELRRYAWSAMRVGNCWYAKRKEGTKTVLMHRQLLGEDCPPTVDHISGDGLDNQRSNLRGCSHKQNCMNARKTVTRPNRTSQFKGVSSNLGVSWCARCGHDRLGFFKSEVAAAIAYDCAARAKYGPFARLNFPYGAG